MNTTYSYFPNLTELIQDVPADTIISRTYYEDDEIKSILFGFAQGQELSEHTASKPAVLHFLSGEAELVLGEDQVTAQEGTWIHMPPNLPHSVLAKTSVLMQLILIG